MPSKVSIVVPIYKVEKYLRRCVDSIINQTYRNLEIILVDDGSPDKCGQIIDEYKENVGQYVTVYLKEKDELKNDKYTGDLVAVNDDNIELSYKDKTRVKKVIINFKQIDKAHLAVKF